MKKLLLSLSLIFSVSAFVNAQTTQEWNISNFTAESITEPKVVDGLTMHDKPTQKEDGSTEAPKMAIDANSKKIDGFEFTQRLKFGGSASVEGESLLPTNRYVSFDVAGNTTITVYGMSSSKNAERTLMITDGIKEIATLVNDGVAIDKVETTYTGSAATIYLYSVTSGFNIYYIKAVTDIPQGIENSNINKEVVSVSYYDLLGRQATETTLGTLIKKVVYDDASVETVKVYVQ